MSALALGSADALRFVLGDLEAASDRATAGASTQITLRYIAIELTE